MRACKACLVWAWVRSTAQMRYPAACDCGARGSSASMSTPAAGTTAPPPSHPPECWEICQKELIGSASTRCSPTAAASRTDHKARGYEFRTSVILRHGEHANHEAVLVIVIHGHELGLPRPPPCSTFRNRLRVRTPEEHCNFVEKLSVVGCSALVLLCHRLRTPLASIWSGSRRCGCSRSRNVTAPLALVSEVQIVFDDAVQGLE